MAAQDTAPRTLISQAQLGRPRGRAIYWTVLVLVVAVFTLAFLGPLYWMVTGALKDGPELAQVPPTLVPLTLMIPSTVLVIPQYVTVIDLPVVHLNLLDSPFAIWLPTVANAFNLFLLKRFFDSIPEDLMAAAAIDGATPLRTLLSIVLPMSRPVIGVVSIFAITNVWKDFLWPLLVEPSPQTRPLNVGIYAFSTGLPQNVVIAAAVIAAVPTIVFFLIFQKNVMAGLTTGALKE